MRKTALLCFLAIIIFAGNLTDAAAIKSEPTITYRPIEPTIVIVEPTSVVVKENITNTNDNINSSRLELIFEKNKSGVWNGFNSIRKIEEMAIYRGVAANTVVLLLLLPLVATMVSLLHYFVGLSGYGIFMPTMIAVALLATGIAGGLILFALILAISLLSNSFLRRYKLHFWPARSINLMFISMGTFGLMVVSTYIPILDISKISIFPVLFMIMLAEEFVRTQLAKSKSEAKKLMAGTLILAIVGAAAMNIRSIQEFVLLNPEISLVTGLVINLIVGSYTGIRFLEIRRFRKAIRKK